MRFDPHSIKQDQLLFGYAEHGYRLSIGATGIQWGKTATGVFWLRNLMLMRAIRHANYIVTSPSYPILAQSTLPPFLKIMGDIGTLHKKDMVFTTDGFGSVWFRTGTNPDSIVGMTDVYGILCDEAGLYGLYFWENIQGRAARLEAPIMIVTSPYSQNWLYQNYVRHLERDPKALPEEQAILIQARSDENPYFSKAEYERKKKTMDARRFRMMFGGEFGKMEGLVFDCWDDVENVIPPQSIPHTADIVAGVDWGNRHAFVVHVRAMLPDGQQWQVAEFYKSGLNPVDMVNAASTLKKAWGIRVFYADRSQPGMIDLFNKNGLSCVPAENDITMGIGFHYELIKSRRFKIFEGKCPYSLDQYSTYHYPSPKDLKPDQDQKEIKPVKVNDDAMDAARYCTAMTYHLSTDGKRKIKGGEIVDIDKMSHDKAIEYIKKRPVRVAERWS